MRMVLVLLHTSGSTNSVEVCSHDMRANGFCCIVTKPCTVALLRLLQAMVIVLQNESLGYSFLTWSCNVRSVTRENTAQACVVQRVLVGTP